jgi:hypothetical protein
MEAAVVDAGDAGEEGVAAEAEGLVEEDFHGSDEARPRILMKTNVV